LIKRLIIPAFNQAQICCLLHHNFNKISIGKEKRRQKIFISSVLIPGEKWSERPILFKKCMQIVCK
jgi:hypothetical protein